MVQATELSQIYSDTTDAWGDFRIEALPGTYIATATMPGYLYAVRTGVVVSEGMTMTLSPVTLPGGDADRDHNVDVTDLVLIGADFGLPVPPGNSRTDINGDGAVNIFDLVLVGVNYELTAPRPWP